MDSFTTVISFINWFKISFFRHNKIYIYFRCFAAVVTDNVDEKKLSDRVKISDR